MVPDVSDRDRFGLGKTALVIAHPGHELCIYQWCRILAPVVYVITDGSGKFTAPRIASTKRVLNEIGASPGSVYGRVSDRVLYDRILTQDVGFFEDLAREIAGGLVKNGIECVLGDPTEFYETAHDVCRMIIDAAARIAWHRWGRVILNLDFPIYAIGRQLAGDSEALTRRLTLSDEELRQKLGAARSYQGIASEPLAQLATRQPELFRVERLRSISAGSYRRPPEKPGYEMDGERGVELGYFKEVIRFETHVRPIAEALEGLS